MKKITCIITILHIALLLFACGQVKPEGKNAVVVVSFGTSFPETRALTIEAIEKDMTKTFPGWKIERAFTSEIIRKVVKKKEGKEILSPETMLARLAEEKYVNILVQPTHVIPGQEYNELMGVVKKNKSLFRSVKVGNPLLSEEADYEKTAAALSDKFPKKKSIVLMGHGNEHHPEYNKAYVKLQKVFDDKKMPVYIGLVEGSPDINSVIKRLKAAGIKEVVLMPFMIVAGDHASNDMASDEKDSWKTVLRKSGIKPEIFLHGIGENNSIRDIYIEHAKKAKAI